MKKYIIVSVLESFEFPLREATRKQIWWTAKEKLIEQYDVEILIFSNFNKTVVFENIQIKFVKRRFLSLYFKADTIHFITGSISVSLLIPTFWLGKKKLTLTDGDMFGYNRIRIRKLILPIISLIYNKIIVYSKYQKGRLKLSKKIFIEKPILPLIIVDPKFERTSKPSLLFMGHLSYFKGVDTIILAFKKLIIEIPDLTWVIANNGIRGDKKLIDEVLRLKKLYPDNIVIKGIVNPIEELSQAWIYLYPFKKAVGTMAFALSLYEAERCNTPYVACDVGANSEFFNPDYLIDVNDSEAMTKKIKYFIDERKVSRNI